MNHKSTDHMIIVEALAAAISIGDISAILELLNEDGEFMIVDRKLQQFEVDKHRYLTWLWERIEEYGVSTDAKLSYEFDQCIHCKIGNPVILFNDGKFPVSTSQPSEKEKIGLMIEILDEKIIGITLCGSFLHHKNPFNFEVRCKNKYG